MALLSLNILYLPRSSHPHISDIVSQSGNMLFSLADDAALTDAVSAAASSASDVASSAAPAIASGVDAVTSVAPDPAAVADAAASASTSGSGWFGFLADGFEGILKVDTCVCWMKCDLSKAFVNVLSLSIAE